MRCGSSVPRSNAGTAPARYLRLYLAAGLCGSAGALILSPNGYTVGASGAIFGLMGAFVAIARVQGSRDLGGVGALIAINLVFTFAIPGISIGGHLGGLAGGLVCGTAYELIARRTRGTTTQILGVLPPSCSRRSLWPSASAPSPNGSAGCLPPARTATLACVSGTPKTSTRLSVLDHKYGSGPPLTIGVEEEYMLLDSKTLGARRLDRRRARGAPRPAVGAARDARAVRVDRRGGDRHLQRRRRRAPRPDAPSGAGWRTRSGRSACASAARPRTRSRSPRTSGSRPATGTATCSSSCSTSRAGSWCSACTSTSRCPTPTPA